MLHVDLMISKTYKSVQFLLNITIFWTTRLKEAKLMLYC